MKTESKAAFEKRMKTIALPEGFTAKFGEEAWGWGENKETHVNFTLVSDAVTIKFDISGSGHTSFKTVKGWLTFDRRGVEDSFYHIKLYDKDDRNLDLNAIVAEQLARVADRVKYYESALPVPGLPGNFTVAPSGVEDLKKRLQKSGFVSFQPAGFGTGYLVAKKPHRGMGYTRAKEELEAFFGCKPLYVTTMDCD